MACINALQLCPHVFALSYKLEAPTYINTQVLIISELALGQWEPRRAIWHGMQRTSDK